MDLPEVNKKLEGEHEFFPDGPLKPKELKAIIEEFVRLHAHCDNARGLCEYNVGQIINGKVVIPYPDIPVIPTAGE